MEIIGLLLSIPVCLIVSVIYSRFAISAYQNEGLSAKILKLITWIVLPFLAIEVILLLSVGPVRAYQIFSKPFYLMHYLVFLTGPPSLTNVIAYQIKKKDWSKRKKIILVSVLCFVFSMSMVLNNVAVSEAIFGVN